MTAEFDKRRIYMTNRINSIRNLSCKLPRGAFYIMMNISDAIGKRIGSTIIDGSLTFADRLLDSKMVSVVPGIAFGTDSFVRLSYAVSMEKIKTGLDRIEEFMEKLA